MKAHYCLDANTLIVAWNVHYPETVFPSLWRKFAPHQSSIILIKPIFDQIDPVSPQDRNKTEKEKEDKYPLRMWMINNQFAETPIDESIERKSLELEKKYQIRKNSRGVDEKDLKLIAYAKLNDKTVVTEEAKQKQEPKKKHNFKIPLVCDEQDVKCINFVEMLMRLDIRV